MNEQEIRQIVFDCLNDDNFIGTIQNKLFNLNGLKTKAEYDAQLNRVKELETEKQSYDSTIESLRDKITEYESANEGLSTKLDQVKAQYKNDEVKLEQYRTDMKSYLSKLETQEKELGELEQANKTLQAQLNESEEHFKTASAESMKNLQEVKRKSERAEILESKIKTCLNDLFDKTCNEINAKADNAEALVKIFDSLFDSVSIFTRLEPAVGDKFVKTSMQCVSSSAKKTGKIAKVLLAGYKDAKGKVIKTSLVQLK